MISTRVLEGSGGMRVHHSALYFPVKFASLRSGQWRPSGGKKMWPDKQSSTLCQVEPLAGDLWNELFFSRVKEFGSWIQQVLGVSARELCWM